MPAILSKQIGDLLVDRMPLTKVEEQARSSEWPLFHGFGAVKVAQAKAIVFHTEEKKVHEEARTQFEQPAAKTEAANLAREVAE